MPARTAIFRLNAPQEPRKPVTPIAVRSWKYAHPARWCDVFAHTAFQQEEQQLSGGAKQRHANIHQSTKLTKRGVLLSGLSLLSIFPTTRPAGAALLRSTASEKPCTLTFLNKTAKNIKIYWNNYDADLEFFALLPPSGEYTIDSFASHPWSLVDAESGRVVQEYTAGEGFQLVPVEEKSGNSTIAEASTNRATDERLEFVGFDGIGGDQADYAPAEVAQVSIDMEGGLAAIRVEGFEEPIGLAIGLPEAAALLYASGIESRRPSTLKTWRQSLKAVGANVERVFLTRLVGHTYYSRIVLSLGPERTLTSLDSRPSDSLALALQTQSPVFVSKSIARANQEELLRILDKKKLGQGGPSKPPAQPLDALDFDKEAGVQDA